MPPTTLNSEEPVYRLANRRIMARNGRKKHARNK